MKSDQSFQRTFYDLSQADVLGFGSLGQQRLVMEGDGTREVDLVPAVVVVLHVAAQKGAEAVRHQTTHARFLQVSGQEGRQACQKTVGERTAIDAVDNLGGRKVVLRQKFVLQCRRHLPFQQVAH